MERWDEAVALVLREWGVKYARLIVRFLGKRNGG
jgi:hypothetical protein